MTLQAEFQTPPRTPPATRSDTPTTRAAADGNPLTLSAHPRLDPETIRAAFSVLPTAVADGEE